MSPTETFWRNQNARERAQQNSPDFVDDDMDGVMGFVRLAGLYPLYFLGADYINEKKRRKQ